MPMSNERSDDRNAEDATNAAHGTSLTGSIYGASAYLDSNDDDAPFTLETINRMRAGGLTLRDAIAAIEAMDK